MLVALRVGLCGEPFQREQCCVCQHAGLHYVYQRNELSSTRVNKEGI